MGVTFIAPAEQFTSPAVLISKEITEDGTYYAADDNANGYSSVEVSVGGGGGGGDFSTAQVTVINNLTSPSGYVITETPNIQQEDDDEWLEGNFSVYNGDTTEATIVLYKGVAYADFMTRPTIVPLIIVTTGDISVEDNLCTITGNGTITITAK